MSSLTKDNLSTSNKTCRLPAVLARNMSYGQVWMIQAMAGFYSWIVAMAKKFFIIRDLINIRQLWDSPTVNDLEDSYGENCVLHLYAMSCTSVVVVSL